MGPRGPLGQFLWLCWPCGGPGDLWSLTVLKSVLQGHPSSSVTSSHGKEVVQTSRKWASQQLHLSPCGAGSPLLPGGRSLFPVSRALGSPSYLSRGQGGGVGGRVWVP